MPIKIPDGLPAQSVLENEHIFVITENRALHQDIRPLKIGILNLMPTKIVTETQIMRSLTIPRSSSKWSLSRHRPITAKILPKSTL